MEIGFLSKKINTLCMHFRNDCNLNVAAIPRIHVFQQLSSCAIPRVISFWLRKPIVARLPTCLHLNGMTSTALVRMLLLARKLIEERMAHHAQCPFDMKIDNLLMYKIEGSSKVH